MSLTRQFFRELRPLFRMLEEPLGRPSTFGSLGYPSTRAFLDDPFFTSPASIRPAVDVSEQGDKYVVEAELPGVKKENINVRIGDGGRTLTIEGKVFSRSAEPQQAQASSTESQPTSSSSAVTAQNPEQTAISTERVFSGTSSFTRTVLLPQPVDSNKVTAKLSDGVLTVEIPKATDTGSVQVNVE
ncbi:HSP20-like chaperone [Lentinus brumalis]|uniref:HSP20-like chaperone n=1 Tax=Lentinus brumalis TaxID=2498619 RepID=A0A371DL93_9APHY|nr:HSP20-like chaperone [Polyporus brumalis]